MIRRPPRSTPKPSSAASDVYKRQGYHLPICGSSLWSFNSSKDLHKMHGPSSSLPPSTRDTDLLVYRRLADCVQGKSTQRHTVCPSHSASTRPVYKLREINLEPSQVMNYIRARLDSIHARMFLPPEHIQKIRRAVQKFKPHGRVSARLAQHLLGLMASTTCTLSHARLKMRSLQSWLLVLFDPLRHSQHKHLTVTPKLAQQLQWWTFLPHLVIGRPF